MKKIICTKEIEFDAIAKNILSKLEKEHKIGASVIALYGDLGSGKTTFAKNIARNLGISSEVTSPTFVIQKRFEIPENNNAFFKNLFHLDVYRIENIDEMAPLGFQKIVSDSKNLVLIEWADKIESLIPKSAIKIKFLFVDDKTREVQIFE